MANETFTVRIDIAKGFDLTIAGWSYTCEVRCRYNGGSDILASSGGPTTDAAILEGLRLLGNARPDAECIRIIAGSLTLRLGDGRIVLPGSSVAL